MMTNCFAGKTYLVVDDFNDMRSMIKSILKTLGVTDIVTASNGRDAVSAIEKNHFDVVLCDYNLGDGRNGQQVLEETRERNLLTNHSLFLMITAENTRDMVMSAIEYEPDTYLSKPFTKDVLKARVEKLLNFKSLCKPVFEAVDVGNYSNAVKLLDHIGDSNPKNRSALLRLRADLCFQNGRYDEAEAIYEQVLGDRAVSWATMGLGKLYFAQGKHNDAEDMFDRLVNGSTPVPSAYDWLARCQRMQGDYEEALETLEAGLLVSPNAVLRQQQHAEVAMLQENYKLAEKSYAKLDRLSQNSIYRTPSMTAGWVGAMSANGKHDSALMTLKKMQQEYKTDREAKLCALVATASVYRNKGDDAKAQVELDSGTKLYEKMAARVPGHLALDYAKSLAGSGNTEAAEAVMKVVVQNNHDDPVFMGRAIEVCREAGISEDPQAMIQSMCKEIIAMNNQGVRLIRDGKLEPAIEFFRKAQEAMLGNKVINLNAALAMIMHMEKAGSNTENLREARACIQQVKTLEPDNERLPQLTRRMRKLS